MAAATTTDGGTTKRCAGLLNEKLTSMHMVSESVLPATLTFGDGRPQSHGVRTESCKRKGRNGLAGGRASRSVSVCSVRCDAVLYWPAV